MNGPVLQELVNVIDLVELTELSWLVCRECGFEARAPGGLHAHARQKHDMDAWTYYSKHRDALRLRFQGNVELVEQVEALGPCWEYQGRRAFNRKNRGSRGYCQMRIAGAPTYAVHRLVLFAFHGQLPTDLVLHQCDYPPCCNPAHLRVGSHTENMAERSERGRTAAGESHYAAALDAFSVRLARQRSTEGWSAVRIARDLDVDPQVIGRLLRGETYRDVPDDEPGELVGPDFIPW